MGRDNLYTHFFMNFSKYFYWERLLPVALDFLGIRQLIRFFFQQNMGKTNLEKAERLAIAALLRAHEKNECKDYRAPPCTVKTGN